MTIGAGFLWPALLGVALAWVVLSTMHHCEAWLKGRNSSGPRPRSINASMARPWVEPQPACLGDRVRRFPDRRREPGRPWLLRRLGSKAASSEKPPILSVLADHLPAAYASAGKTDRKNAGSPMVTANDCVRRQLT